MNDIGSTLPPKTAEIQRTVTAETLGVHLQVHATETLTIAVEKNNKLSGKGSNVFEIPAPKEGLDLSGSLASLSVVLSKFGFEGSQPTTGKTAEGINTTGTVGGNVMTQGGMTNSLIYMISQGMKNSLNMAQSAQASMNATSAAMQSSAATENSKMSQEVATAIKQAEDAEKSAETSKIISWITAAVEVIASVALIVAGVLTANPMLIAAGVIVGVMAAVQITQNIMTEAYGGNLPPGWQLAFGITQMVLTVALIVVTAGAASALSGIAFGLAVTSTVLQSASVVVTLATTILQFLLQTNDSYSQKTKDDISEAIKILGWVNVGLTIGAAGTGIASGVVAWRQASQLANSASQTSETMVEMADMSADASSQVKNSVTSSKDMTQGSANYGKTITETAEMSEEMAEMSTTLSEQGQKTFGQIQAKENLMTSQGELAESEGLLTKAQAKMVDNVSKEGSVSSRVAKGVHMGGDIGGAIDSVSKGAISIEEGSFKLQIQDLQSDYNKLVLEVSDLKAQNAFLNTFMEVLKGFAEQAIQNYTRAGNIMVDVVQTNSTVPVMSNA